MKRFNIWRLLSFLWLVLLTVFSGCGVFRNVKSEKKTDTRDSVAKTVLVDKSTEKTTDKTVITTTETVNRKATVPGFSVEVASPADLSMVKNGLVLFQDDRIKVSQALDEQSGVLKTNINVRPRDVEVPVQKKKVEERNVVTEKQADISQKTKTAVKEKHVEEHKVSSPNYNWIWYVAGLAALVYLAFYLYKKLF